MIYLSFLIAVTIILHISSTVLPGHLSISDRSGVSGCRREHDIGIGGPDPAPALQSGFDGRPSVYERRPERRTEMPRL